MSSRQGGVARRTKAQLSWERKRNSARGKEAEYEPLQQQWADAVGQHAAQQEQPVYLETPLRSQLQSNTHSSSEFKQVSIVKLRGGCDVIIQLGVIWGLDEA